MTSVAPKILRLSDVIARTGLGKTTIYRLMDRGEFPQSFNISERAAGWLEESVTAWIMARAAEARTTIGQRAA